MKAVLTYHSIDDSGSPVSVPESAFRAHVAWLASGRVRVVPLEVLLQWEGDEDVVSVTFDDGLESVATVAAPLMAPHGLPATVFVVADRVGETNDWERRDGVTRVPSLRLMDWEALGRLAQDGFSLGGHTRTHPRLPGLSDAALAEELAGGRARIEAETGVPAPTFAYPYGALDDRVVRATAGVFEAAVTTELRAVPPVVDPWRIPRLDMVYFRDPRRLASFGTAGFRAWLGARRLARRVRSAVAG